jgi:hypothetical protein
MIGNIDADLIHDRDCKGVDLARADASRPAVNRSPRKVAQYRGCHGRAYRVQIASK